MEKVFVYDSTLRDGTQGEGISFSVNDKLRIVKRLDELGIDYIEAGNPGSNPKDLEFFLRASQMELSHAKICAFGSTHRVGVPVQNDKNVISLLSANTPVVAVFGKSWDLHVTEILKTTLEDNLQIIRDTVSFFKAHEKEVVFDAEHFFDGYKQNPEYALETVKAAEDVGADWIVLCETNGGAFPDEVEGITKRVKQVIGAKIGIHCHNDGGMAVANSVMAVKAGASQVQGTVNGIGERCGNTNLCSVIPNLQLKLGYSCILKENMQSLTKTARYVSELANVAHDERQPYVGQSAFAHKGGMHIDGVQKNPKTFEHVDPGAVGNQRRFLVSEMSGRSNLMHVIHDIDPTIEKHSPVTQRIMDKLKEMEFGGYQFEGAESSVELMVRRELGAYRPFFNLEQFKVFIDEPVQAQEYSSSAMIKIEVDGKEEINAAQGEGPVNAMDKALRKALERFYPTIGKIRLSDYKVRVLDSKDATAARVRVLIETTDGENTWNTIGVSTDIIEASLQALVDSVEYKLYLDQKQSQ